MQGKNKAVKKGQKKGLLEEIKSAIKDLAHHIHDHYSHKKLTPISVSAQRPKKHHR